MNTTEDQKETKKEKAVLNYQKIGVILASSVSTQYAAGFLRQLLETHKNLNKEFGIQGKAPESDALLEDFIQAATAAEDMFRRNSEHMEGLLVGVDGYFLEKAKKTHALNGHGKILGMNGEPLEVAKNGSEETAMQ